MLDVFSTNRKIEKVRGINSFENQQLMRFTTETTKS